MQENINQACQTIRSLILQDKMKQALEELNKLTVLFQSQLLTDEVIQLAGKHKKLIKETAAGILTYEEKDVSLNRLRKTIFDFIQAVEKEDITDEALLSIFQQSYKEINEALTINQQHSGSGDNIYGDKNINKITFKPLLLIILFGLTLFIWYENQDKINHAFGCDKVFSNKDSQFKILIVPFKAMCEKDENKDIGSFINDRLTALNVKDSLNIHPYYLDIEIPKNFNGDIAKNLQEYHNADQIIYGNYYDKACGGTVEDKICYNWITDERWNFDSLQKNMLFSSNFQKFTIEDLIEGKIQVKTEYIIYWLAGLTSYNQLHYSKALKYWLDLYREPEFINYSLVNMLGKVYFDLADYENAHKFYKKLLFLSQSRQDSSTAIAYNNLGMVFQVRGKYDKAIEHYQKAIDIFNKITKRKHLKLATCYNNLGGAWRKKRQPNKAIEYYQKAIDIDLRVFGENHQRIAAYYNNLGEVYSSKGEYNKAIEYHQKALDIDLEIFGKQHPDIATFYNNLGVAYKERGEYDRSIEYYQKAIDINLGIFGENHQRIAIYYNNLGEGLKAKEKYDKAIEYYQKAIDCESGTIGESHLRIAIYYNNIGELYYSKGEYNKAVKIFEKSKVIYDKYLDSTHPYQKLIELNLSNAKEQKDKSPTPQNR